MPAKTHALDKLNNRKRPLSLAPRTANSGDNTVSVIEPTR
jgi:hypothetical protein